MRFLREKENVLLMGPLGVGKKKMAEGVGFEPTVGVAAHNSFRDRLDIIRKYM